MFKFQNPKRIKINQRTADHFTEVNTTGDVWTFEDGGQVFKLDFNHLPCTEVRDIFKAFAIYRLELFAPSTVVNLDARVMLGLCSTPLKHYFPWLDQDVIDFANELKSQGSNLAAFRKFYKWALDRSIQGFDKNVYLRLKELKIENHTDYEDVLLRKHVLTEQEENLLIQWIDRPVKKDFKSLRDIIILQLLYELGPRPIQIHTLDIGDLVKFQASESIAYYTINLPMAKKIASGLPEKRPRRISEKLGNKIELLISMMPIGNTKPLFVDAKTNKRLSSVQISSIAKSCLKNVGLKNNRNARTLRHHLAQSIADQGGSAEVIAELLGHNSTVSAKHYIEATPTMAKIKTIALGKSDAFIDIIRMFTTGEIISDKDINSNQLVKGMVGTQYIGGIGACGLPENTSCPKNPVYSCYTCKKFHPFKNGKHSEVKNALETQAQFFVDTAIAGIDFDHNRTVTQLANTIKAVDIVMTRISNLKSDS